MIIFIDTIRAIILGIVEGFTEFLPISSTGHLILVNQWLSFEKDFTNLFDIFIQLGAILAVIVFFWKKLWKKDIWIKSIIGVIPALILGLFFAGIIEEKLFNPWTVAITLLFGGLIILYIENKKQKPKINSIKELSIKTILLIGVIQSLAMIPGVSRSGATIIGALALGASRVVATEFSFFLAIPTILAASGYSLLKYHTILNTNHSITLGIGFFISFLVALLVIKFFINYIQKNNFKLFGWYRIILSIIIILFLQLNKI
jgi:undecaprenyl-diphosphatase